MNPNLQAGLTCIATCEGTNYPNGYSYLYGSRPTHERLFTDFSDHPRRKFHFDGREFLPDEIPEPYHYTTAAGRYQITESIFDRLNRMFPGRWPGFGPEVQDEMAIELISERGARMDFVAGRLRTALAKCASVWASLPTSRAGQPTRSYQFAEDAFRAAGGVVSVV